MKSPCYKCENRTAECRLSCADWKQYEITHAIEIAERRKIKQQADDVNSFRFDGAENGRRRKK